jgi:hypothetical protein
VLAAIGIIAGIVLGCAVGGRLSHIPELDPGLMVLLVSLSLAQGVARGRVLGLSPTPAGLAVWVLVSLLFCAAAYWRSSQYTDALGAVRGFALIGAGTLANVLVVLLNQGMPVVGALGSAYQIASSGGFYVYMNEGTVLPWLGDVLLVSFGRTRFLLSLGDVALLVGMAVLMLELMLSGSTTPSRGKSSLKQST